MKTANIIIILFITSIYIEPVFTRDWIEVLNNQYCGGLVYRQQPQCPSLDSDCSTDFADGRCIGLDLDVVDAWVAWLDGLYREDFRRCCPDPDRSEDFESDQKCNESIGLKNGDYTYCKKGHIFVVGKKNRINNEESKEHCIVNKNCTGGKYCVGQPIVRRKCYVIVGSEEKKEKEKKKTIYVEESDNTLMIVIIIISIVVLIVIGIGVRFYFWPRMGKAKNGQDHLVENGQNKKKPRKKNMKKRKNGQNHSVENGHNKKMEKAGKQNMKKGKKVIIV
ncbi:unnamed protein product [Caenorhabditis angaria]|uniref:Domain of unknown function DX domain-containing protein n=1 Tax=Caenorhabditis angaria TaxID=860376 RepID=A0A9P1IJX9_9PELO|nr:unnamed protein product [Caenorhabditis angaria]